MGLDASGPSADLLYRLRRLRTAGTVLHLGTHPDDEDVGLIAYLSRGRDLRTVYWSATRGEGGQNRQGSERGEALGIVRTWESLDARRVDGGEVRYGPFFDFGFSKSGEAALAAWGHEDLVREIVRAVRTVRPQVVVSRWSGGPEDGHGQHQAVGLVAEEAIRAAADPGRFADLPGPAAIPWAARKVYVSLAPDWQPGEDGAFLSFAAPPGPGVVVVRTGGLDPVSELTYQELGCIAFNRHRTQGMAFVPEAGDFAYSYRRVMSAVPVADPEGDLFDRLDPSLTGLADHPGAGSKRLRAALSGVMAVVDRAVESFRPDSPGEAGRLVLDSLSALRGTLDGLDGEPLDTARGALREILEAKVGEFERVAAGCLGLRMECLSAPARVVPGSYLRVVARLWSLGNLPVRVDGVDLSVPPGWAVRSEGPAEHRAGVAAEQAFRVSVPEDATPSSPYWLRSPRLPFRYVWPEEGPVGDPFDPSPVLARCILTVGGVGLTLEAEAVHRETFVGGFRELAPAILPAMALEPREASSFMLTRPEPQAMDLGVAIRSTHEGGAKGTLSLAVPEGWGVEPEEVDLVLPGRGASQSVRTRVTVPAGAGAGVHDLRFEVTSGQRRPGVIVMPVRLAAPGVPRPADETNFVREVFVASPATVAVHLLDAEFVPGLRYGYVAGARELVVASLARFGLDLAVLGEEEVRFADLSAFDTIVIGPNAYLLREDVRANAGRLLDYVAAGGTLLVQYQGYGYDAEGLAPYPFRYRQPHDRVTFADAPVEVLAPGNPVLHVPNEITAEDFSGWVHDRGMYFFGEWDPAYASVIASNDPGEDPKAGGLLVAAHGRGTYVYTGYSFFRQIPAGVPGAVRLFANLLGIPEARVRERMAMARRVKLFTFMSDEQLHEVARLMSEVIVEPGAYLARQGEPGGELFLVLDGEVEVVKEGGSGVKTLVVGSGEVVGELAVLADVPRSASLRARGPVRILTVQGGPFRHLLRSHPDLADGVIRLLATRLAATEQAQGEVPPSGSD